MFEYEMHQLRAADLGREAADGRLLREARTVRAAARRSAGHEAEGQVSKPLGKVIGKTLGKTFGKTRFTRAA
ncbi:hypothetical protein AB0B50_12410 [Streptomyces sp. NPDC041068]|uniref:hypothetical protein n=1 Tax=Streptomyces sp. NPDC041068 TaxID=3155130 RepID=UPI0033FB7FDF